MGASALKEMYSYWNKNAYFQDLYTFITSYVHNGWNVPRIIY